jgi:hypothetical protein
MWGKKSSCTRSTSEIDVSVSRDELERRLKDYGCSIRADMGASMDMWLTGWGQPFFLRRSASGKYDDGACNDVVYRATIKMRTIYGRPWFPAPPDPPIEPGSIRHRALEGGRGAGF